MHSIKILNEMMAKVDLSDEGLPLSQREKSLG